ncbi:MAG: hypothetical protein WKG01_34530 [Kofleriaceae bacterium]
MTATYRDNEAGHAKAERADERGRLDAAARTAKAELEAKADALARQRANYERGYKARANRFNRGELVIRVALCIAAGIWLVYSLVN